MYNWVKILPVLIFFLSTPVVAEARSGCCSHHRGVCGCRCCDGTALSAKCAPYYPSCNTAPVLLKEPESYPTKKPTFTPTFIPTSPTVRTTSPFSTSQVKGVINNQSQTDSSGGIGGIVILGGIIYAGYRFLNKLKK